MKILKFCKDLSNKKKSTKNHTSNIPQYSFDKMFHRHHNLIVKVTTIANLNKL